MNDAIVHRLSVYRLRSSRSTGSGTSTDISRDDSILVVKLETARGVAGYGECPLTADSLTDVDRILERLLNDSFVPQLMEFHPASFPEALEAIESLPFATAQDNSTRSVRVAFELALLDLSMRAFDRGADALVRWMGLPGFGSPGSLPRVALARVLPAVDNSDTKRELRRQYWRGIRHFKIVCDGGNDDQRLRAATEYLGKTLDKGTATLRIDAGGLWTKDGAVDWLADLNDFPLAGLEQPLPRGNEADLSLLKDLTEIPIILDESVTNTTEAQALCSLGLADGIQLDLLKCGGFMPALRVAAIARRQRIPVILGVADCGTEITMGTTIRFLSVCPGITWIDEPCQREQLAHRITKHRVRLRVGGRSLRSVEPGWGIDVIDRQLMHASITDHLEFNL